MERYTYFAMTMNTEAMAIKALEIMKSILVQVDTTGFQYDSRENLDSFAGSLMVKGSEIINNQPYGLTPETYDIVLPEMFKAVARCFYLEKITAVVIYDSTYAWEKFDISYENGELIIKSLHHDNCEEPYCQDCEDYYEYFVEDGIEGYRCCECGHTIPVEEYKAACEQYFENVYAIL